MPPEYLIGVDIGTQGTKTALYSLDGQYVAGAFEASRLIRPAKGVVKQEADDLYGSVVRTISEVITKAGVLASHVLAIGVDGQMAGILGIDRDWNPVTYYDSWLDTRCEKYIAQIKAEDESRIIEITGCPVTYAHGPKILWWKNERPDIYAKIHKFILPTTYVVGKLAGLKAEAAFIDYTHLHFSGFGDVAQMAWSDELLNLFKVEKEKMPRIVKPWEIIGYLTKEAADQCSLITGIPIVAGCGDQAATSLAAGVTRKGIVFDVAGTASVFSCSVGQYKPDVTNKTLMYPRSVIPGLWIPLAYINGGGLCLEWFRENLTGNGPPISYQELEHMAENIAIGSEGLLFLPHFSGRVCPNNPHVRGTWIGLSWIHTRDHMYRSIMEGIAYEYYYYLRTIKCLFPDMEFSHVYALGGGAKSKLFNSIKADVLGINYKTLSAYNTATLGSAVVAGYGVKAYDNLEQTIDRFIEFESQVAYNPIRHAQYSRFSYIYENCFNALEPTFKALSQTWEE